METHNTELSAAKDYPLRLGMALIAALIPWVVHWLVKGNVWGYWQEGYWVTSAIIFLFVLLIIPAAMKWQRKQDEEAAEIASKIR